MSRPTIETLRTQLRASRRKHNLILALGQLGYWFAAVLATFIAFAAIVTVFNLQGLLLQVVFAAWVCAIFAVSFTCYWRFSVQLQNDSRFAHDLEQRLPDLEQRVITSLEFDESRLQDEGLSLRGVSPQFVRQLWQDTNSRVETTPLKNRQVITASSLGLIYASIAGLCLTVLLFSSDQFLQAGRDMLWPFNEQQVAEAETDATVLPVAINVEPGDVSLQRGDDLTVVAALDNATASQLTLYLQDDNVNWQRFTMAPEAGQDKTAAKVFTLDLHQLSQDAVYYVEYRKANIADSEPVNSPQYNITLFDLPRVEDLTLTYDFPDYTGMEDREENPGGDIVAPEGTKITVSAALNKTVETAQLLFEGGEAMDLAVDGKNVVAEFTVTENTSYRFELFDDKGFKNKDPLDYYVRAIKDQPPEIALKYPGKDQEVMPLEEVEIEVDAKDDYGLTEFALQYSVIGVDEKNVDFLGRQNIQTVKAKTGNTLLYLEELNVQPGDVVSYSFAVADNNGLQGPNKIISDIYFLEVTSPDQEFSRARGGGGGGGGGAGGGGDSNALIKNQKDVISATWKLRNREDKVSEDSFTADATIIRDSQEQVAERAQMSINRLTERGDFADDNYTNAVTFLQTSIEEMNSATALLDEQDLINALQHEQRALQAILRAESQINKTEVSMSRNGGGGGGGGNREREDLRELFEMELGQLENRYELPQQGGGQQSSQGRNELLDKLEELARRQERLTRSQRELARRENQMSEEQKRKQLEQLRRQQEELQRELQQLAQQSAQQQRSSQQQQQSSSSSSSSSSSQQSASSQQSQQQRQQQVAEANRQLQRAMEQMRDAAESESPAQAAARGQKALDSLREQVQQWGDQQNQSVAELQQAVKDQTDEIVQQQRQLRDAVEELSREQSLGDSRFQTAGSEDTAELMQQQRALQTALDELGQKLREIATRAGDDERKALEQAHDLSRELRPIRERMDTSSQILERGMVNLSLKIENDIEAQLNTLQAQVRGIGTGGSADPQDQQRQLANQVRQLRESLQQLENQTQQFREPSNLQRRQGERSGASQQPGNRSGEVQGGEITRNEMEESLQRSRELAQGLVELGRNSAGGAMRGNARSIRSQLTQQGLEEFLNRPDLLQALINPVLEMEKELRVQSELNMINERLYSQLDEDIPEQYKTLVEEYYRGLSESKPPSVGTQ